MRPASTPVYPRIKAVGIFCAWSKSFSKITCPIPLLLPASASDLPFFQKHLMRQRTNPDTRGGGLAKVDDAIADGKRHRFVIFAPPDAHSRTWMQREP